MRKPFIFIPFLALQTQFHDSFTTIKKANQSRLLPRRGINPFDTRIFNYMATFDDLKFRHRVFVSNYPFSRYSVDDNPGTKLKKPLSECKFALVTTAGFMRPDDKRFSSLLKMGDPSFREIPNDFPVQELIEDHDSDSFSHDGIEADKNIAFPLDRFKELESDGKIGSLNQRHLSFMGSIISPRKLIKETAPQAANLLKEDSVDAVFLAPVCPFCVQAVGLIAAAIERVGISTVSLSLLEEITKVIKPPRALFVPFDLGFPLGEPNNPRLQHKILKSALDLFKRDKTPLIERF